MAPSIEYVELRCRSNYSFLRGASFPEELVAQAVQLGLRGLALTDLDGVYGLPRAWTQARDFPAFKLITGAELTLEGHPPLTLLAQDKAGYALLCRLLTAAHADKPKGEAALAWKTFLEMMSWPGGQGLLALPSMQSIQSMPSIKEEPDLGSLKDLFTGRLYLPLA